MTDKPDAGEAARRIEKAFTTGGAYSGDDPVIVARALLSSSKRIEELEKALRECGADYISPPCTVTEGAAYVAAEFQRRMAIARAALENT